jgi:hypothetical protein
VKALVVNNHLFEPFTVSETRLENLLTTTAPTGFSGFNYFEFKPRIRCRDGNRHPDGALLAPGSPNWWVVEVETHLHDPQTHIEPQISDLMAGMYGPDAFDYLRRHESFNPDEYPVDPYDPSFLLIIDSLTHEIAQMAARLAVPVVECSVYRDAETNQFALTMDGFWPQVQEDLRTGISLLLKEREEFAVLVPADGRPVPSLRHLEILLGDSAYECHLLSGSQGIVMPLKRSEVEAVISCSARYKLITKSMRLIADPDRT